MYSKVSSLHYVAREMKQEDWVLMIADPSNGLEIRAQAA
jgi:ABC-type uncharacterized transport system ATPase subunit